jgi:hypothetical protein
VTIHLVDIHVVTHTCPADPQPHAIDTRQTVLHTTPGRPCLTPVTVHGATATVVIDCARHEPHERQCANCRTIITVRTVTTEHLGYQGPAHLAPTPAEDAA